MVMWNMQIEILYILGHTYNNKHRLYNIRNSKFYSRLQQQIDIIMEKVRNISDVLRGNCCENCRHIP